MDERTQAILLLAVAAVSIRLGITDAALAYVRPGLQPALLLAGSCLAVLGAYALRRAYRPTPDADVAHHDHAPGVAWMLAIPLLTLLLVAPAPLGSFAAARQGTAPPAMSPVGFTELPQPHEGAVDLSIREYVQRALYDQETSLEGTRVRLVGFVTPLDDDGDADGRYLLTRFAVNCCAADATALTIEVVGDQARAADTWLEIEGRWQPRDGHQPGTVGSEPPLLVAERVTPFLSRSNPTSTDVRLARAAMRSAAPAESRRTDPVDRVVAGQKVYLVVLGASSSVTPMA
ncbi:TIGR03943 family protein [Jiangella aurantiaca]|uniref:TIGR03943 family protein n=1 Tax=Jiangella aurantiaca TaxID=2530373 RepID=A0A4R4ZYC5_9ACTN|nr:TIGR03943 family protein [Jiangella aurantiaca]TDD64035.1 TIGR03943 family protein [Jiangella aurantiaca]